MQVTGRGDGRRPPTWAEMFGGDSVPGGPRELYVYAGRALGLARVVVPLRYGVTVIVHDYEGDEWSVSSTIVDPTELDLVLTNAHNAAAAAPKR